MKIGLSFSRCLLDIVEGRINKDEVLVIIARTDFNPNDDEGWKEIWNTYLYGGLSNAEWAGYEDDEDLFRNLAKDLYNNGKLHQPRQFGAYPQRRPEHWLEVVLPNSELDQNPAAKKAWENFQIIAGLVNVKLDKGYN